MSLYTAYKKTIKHAKKHWYKYGIGAAAAIACLTLLCNYRGIEKRTASGDTGTTKNDLVSKVKTEEKVIGPQEAHGTFTYETTDKEPCTDY